MDTLHSLVVLSDLHLGSGRWTKHGKVNSLEEFHHDQPLIELIRYFSENEYKAKPVTLVLNGDILEFLLEGDEFCSEFTEKHCFDHTEKIIRAHTEVFKALKKFARRPYHRIVYVVGNHDPGVLWIRVKNLLRNTIDSQITFPNIVYKIDDVWIEHGQQYTMSTAYDLTKIYKAGSKATEKVLNLPWGSWFLIDTVKSLKNERGYIDQIYPFPDYIRWALKNDTKFILKAGISSLRFFGEGSYFFRYPRFGGVATFLKIMFNAFSFDTDLVEAAHDVLQSKAFNTVVFGHTHHPMLHRYEDGKTYINTGTWVNAISLTKKSPVNEQNLTFALLQKEGIHGKWTSELLEWTNSGYQTFRDENEHTRLDRPENHLPGKSW